MNNIAKIRSFFISRIFGLLLIAIGITTILSLVTYSVNDPTFGSVSTSAEIDNFLGVYGAYISGLLIISLSILCYLIPIFFLIAGYRKILGFKYDLFIIRALFFIFGILLITIPFSFLKYNSGIIGVFLNEFYIIYLSKYFLNFYLESLFQFVIFCISLLLIYFGLALRFKFLFYILKKILKIIYYVFIPFKLIKIPPIKIKSKEHINKNKNILKSKKEPTIHKRKYFDSSEEMPKNFESEYMLPPLSLLKKSNEKKSNTGVVEKRNINFSKKLKVILEDYGVFGEIDNFKTGPVITLFEFIPAAGIKTSKVVGLSEDIARAMSSISARISFQPGKNSIAIEIPNDVRESVLLGDLFSNDEFGNEGKNLTLALGKNISGEKKFTDLEKMPHLLIAGTTGSGKSVGINSMILSLLFKFKPSECKLILIDPKMLELSVYEDIPHLMSPVVTDPNKAVRALRWVVREMENRYRLMSSTNVKNIQSFNAKIDLTLSQGRKIYREVQTGFDNETGKPILERKEIDLDRMPFIVVIIDEMADLMMVAGKEVENLVQRLAQMARASGIHLITATQRPSVDVITGTIKANFPSRISFRVASKFDSRTILNEMGAEQLLGSGDMLFCENGSNIIRLHGGFVSEEEIEKVVSYIKSQSTSEPQKDITNEEIKDNNNELNFNLQSKNADDLYGQAVSIVIEKQKVSTSFIQRYLQIGYNRAANIVEQMEAEGIISEPTNAGKRSVLKKK